MNKMTELFRHNFIVKVTSRKEDLQFRRLLAAGNVTILGDKARYEDNRPVYPTYYLLTTYRDVPYVQWDTKWESSMVYVDSQHDTALILSLKALRQMLRHVEKACDQDI